MCELFAQSFSAPAGLTEYFDRFAARSVSNPDGWGLAWYPDKAVRMVKEPRPGGKSRLVEIIGSSPEVESHLYVGHLRKTNSSIVAYENTHPFHRELFGRDFIFAHNGNVTSLKAVSPGRFQPVGGTDSEHAFCLLLSRLEGRSPWTGTSQDLEWLAAQLTELNRFGKFSCLFSDGDILACHRDREGANNLSYLTAQLGAERGIVIASEPLSSEQWMPFQPGEMIAFRRGGLVYSSTGRRAV